MTLLRHAHILTMDESLTEHKDGFILFDESGIIDIGDECQFPKEYGSIKAEDMAGEIVIPSFINTHTHLGMVPFRSLADDEKDRLRRFLMPLENIAMTPELVRAASKIAMAEMLLSGTATAVDMYYFPTEAARSANEMGFRLYEGASFLDKKHPDADDFDSSIARFESLLKETEGMRTVKAAIAPHAPYSVSIEGLRRCASLSKETGCLLTMHLSEMTFEMEQFQNEYGRTPIRVLHDEGILSERTIAAHAIYANDDDIALLKDSGTSVSHCPGANAKGAKGVAPIREMIDRGVNVTLGTDGPSSGNTLDSLTLLKLVALLQKNRLHDRSAFPAKGILPLATRSGGIALGENIGELKKGYKADITVFGTSSPNMAPCHDAYSSIVYSAHTEDVERVYVDGVLKVKGRTLVGLDLKQMMNDFKEASKDFLKEAMKLL